MNDDKLRASAERGRQMRVWAEGSGGLFEVISAVERDYMKTLVASDITEALLRENIYHRIAALKDIEKVMHAVIIAGKGAAAQIEALTKAAQKKQQRKKRTTPNV